MIQGLKQLTRGSVVSVVSLFLFLPLAASAGSKAEKIYRKVLPSVMTLEVENRLGEHFVGSGVVGLADDCVVTAWHVVSDARLVSAVFADGTRVHVELTYRPIGGLIGHAIARMFGFDPRRRLDQDLIRMKALLEDGHTRAHHQRYDLSKLS